MIYFKKENICSSLGSIFFARVTTVKTTCSPIVEGVWSHPTDEAKEERAYQDHVIQKL
jgi:hypothetical protein